MPVGADTEMGLERRAELQIASPVNGEGRNGFASTTFVYPPTALSRPEWQWTAALTGVVPAIRIDDGIADVRSPGLWAFAVPSRPPLAEARSASAVGLLMPVQILIECGAAFD